MPALTQSEYSNLKRRLTLAKRSGDRTRIEQEVRHAVATFNEKGWPDDWARWKVALEDAVEIADLGRVDELFNL